MALDLLELASVAHSEFADVGLLEAVSARLIQIPTTILLGAGDRVLPMKEVVQHIFLTYVWYLIRLSQFNPLIIIFSCSI